MARRENLAIVSLNNHVCGVGGSIISLIATANAISIPIHIEHFSFLLSSW
jgi:hypothetical protein